MKKLLLAVSILFLAPASHAVSFDCKKATTLVENVICSDDELSNLDDVLSSSYRDAVANAGKNSGVTVSQRNWLKKRNSCKNKGCLKNLYTQRINELINVSASASYQSNNGSWPKNIGDCADSTIVGKFTRFENSVPGEAGGEVFVTLKNEISLYIQSVPTLPDSANLDKYMYGTSDFVKGDKVSLCLFALPDNCPAGDERGKVYSVTNHKNQKVFIGVDSWHQCGGA